MAKEDISLPVEMGKLEIEPVKTKNKADMNPFSHSLSQLKRHLITRSSTQTSRCHCSTQKIKNPLSICKKKNNSKILKKPVLKLLQNYCKDAEDPHKCYTYPNKLASPQIEKVKSENSLLCALVDNCNQLKISSECENGLVLSSTRNDTEWWKKELPCNSIQNRESASDKSRAGPSCSQEALNPPCDVTIDELASYFETFVHIPKKMSSMAEMMYI